MNEGLLINSLLVSGLATLLSVGFGLAASLCIAGLNTRARIVLLGIAVVALAFPPFLVTNCWLHFLGPAWVWRGSVHLNIMSLPGAIWISSLLTWPITMLAVSSAWRRLEAAQLESDPSVTGWGMVRAILWPLSRPALVLASVLTFVLALNNFAVPAILQVKVFPAEVWVKFNTTFDTPAALQMSWPMVLAPIILLAVCLRGQVPWPHVEGEIPSALFRRQLGVGFFWSCCFCTSALGFLSVGLPLLQLVAVKRTWTELPGALAAGHSAISNSFWFAALTAALVVILALALSGSNRSFASGGPAQKVFTLLLWVPFLIPGVLMGIGLIMLFNHSWSALFYQSAGIVILALGVRYFALGWTTVVHALSTVDPDLLDAARLEGATRWQILRLVQWPQIAPEIKAGWYVVFVLCLWDVESIILIMPPGGETLALRVFNLLHYGHNAQVNALCLSLLAVALAPLAVWGVWNLLRAKSLAPRWRDSGKSNFTPALVLLLCLGAVLTLTGCGPQTTTNEAPIKSELFQRVAIIGSRGAAVGELNKPRSVAVDTHDNLFVVDMTGRVQKFSPSGVFQLLWQMPQTEKGKPKGMTRDREGNIVVIEPHYQRLNYFTPDGKLLAQWGDRGTNEGQLIMPRAAAINSRGEIFVSEYGEVERVQKFLFNLPDARSQAGSAAPSREQFISSFGKMGNEPGEFNRPEGLCVGTHDFIYVADSCNHRIQIFSSDGKYIRSHGKAGSGKGEMSYPYDICVDSAGSQYVCEFGNSRIQIFDSNDQPIEIIGGPGAEPGKFSNPWGVALDSAGNLYVADSQNHRVQKFIRKPGAVALNQK